MQFVVKKKPVAVERSTPGSLNAILPSVENWMLNKGLKLQERLEPLEYDKLPRDITKMASQQLGVMLSNFTEQSSFLEGEVAIADTGYTLASTELDLYERKFLFTAKADSAAEKKIMLGVDDKYIELVREKMNWHARLTILKGHLHAAEKNYTSASREISRRAGDFERREREGNVR